MISKYRLTSEELFVFNTVDNHKYRKKRKMTSKEKTKYRSTGEWKKFRNHLLTKHNSTCQICGIKKYGKQKRLLQVHHLDDCNYKDLKDEKFALICVSCHKNIERFLKRKDFNLSEYFDKFRIVFEGSKKYVKK